MINERLRLSVGAAPLQRGFAVIFGMVFAAFGGLFVVLPLAFDGFLRRFTSFDDGYRYAGDGPDLSDLDPPPFSSSGDGTWWDGFGIGPARYIGICGIPFVLIGLYFALQALRTAAWLDGTKATVRGALVTRTVDLATADVSVGAVANRRNSDGTHVTVHRIPTIVAADRGTGRKVTIPLQGMGMATLPPHELRALADAMTSGRATTGRDADVHTIAHQLRAMAENPLGL